MPQSSQVFVGSISSEFVQGLKGLSAGVLQRFVWFKCLCRFNKGSQKVGVSVSGST